MRLFESLAHPRALLIACLVSLPGCAQVLDIPDDPELVPEESGGPWGCLNRPNTPPGAPQADTALVRVQACNFVSNNCSEPATGITARLCDKKDVMCLTPIGPPIPDVGGALVFQVPTGGSLGAGFEGYLQVAPPLELCTNQSVFGPAWSSLCALATAQNGCDVSDPDDRCKLPTFGPSLLFFNPPIKADVTPPIPLPLIPTAQVPNLIQAGGGNFDPSTGVLFITAVDCNGVPAPGVTFQIDRHRDIATPMYLDNGVVSNAATQTDASGSGGFIGVPAGFATIAGEVEIQPGVKVRVGELGVQSAPFTITKATLAPTG